MAANLSLYTSVTLWDMIPWSSWEKKTVKRLRPDSKFFYVKAHFDSFSKRYYRCEKSYVTKERETIIHLETPNYIRIKCAVLTFLVGYQLFKTVYFSALRVAKILFLYHFWSNSVPDSSLKGRFIEFSKDALKIAFAPLLFVGLFLSGIWGIVRPYDGRKVYASYERLLFTEYKKQYIWNITPKDFWKTLEQNEAGCCEWTLKRIVGELLLNPPCHLAACFQPLSLTKAEIEANVYKGPNIDTISIGVPKDKPNTNSNPDIGTINTGNSKD